MEKTSEISIQGFILAGGASSRMGMAKPGLKIGGRSMVRRSLDTLSQVADTVHIVGGSTADTIEDVELPRLPDVDAKGRGAMRGVVTALQACSVTWACVLACDLPFVSGELLELLVRSTNPGVDAVVPVQRDGRMQPLCALYRREVCLPLAAAAIEQQQWSMHRFLDHLRLRPIEYSDYQHLPHSSDLFLNINSPEDLAAANLIEAERTNSSPS
jgi:molybdopterin-guanine dinucleotide biosynthesis protein A